MKEVSMTTKKLPREISMLGERFIPTDEQHETRQWDIGKSIIIQPF